MILTDITSWIPGVLLLATTLYAFLLFDVSLRPSPAYYQPLLTEQLHGIQLEIPWLSSSRGRAHGLGQNKDRSTKKPRRCDFAYGDSQQYDL